MPGDDNNTWTNQKNHMIMYLGYILRYILLKATEKGNFAASVLGILQARILEWVASPFSFPSPGDLLHPGTEPVSPTLQVDSLPSEPPGKPQTTL